MFTQKLISFDKILKTKSTIMFLTYEEMCHWISCKAIHSYRIGGQITHEFIIGIKITVKVAMTPRNC